MKQPKDRNSPRDLKRMRSWTANIATYRAGMSEGRIRDWIDQFDEEDRDIAARILDCIEFYAHDHITAVFQTLLKGLEGWHKNEDERVGQWRFAAYSSGEADSGHSMLHMFRTANNLGGSKYDKLFIHRSDILNQHLGADDTIVLIDDFVGSGDQACATWEFPFGELLAGVGQVYLVVVSACKRAVERIAKETDLQVIPHVSLNDSDNVFASKCKCFNRSEKEALLRYCKIADKKKPKGHDDCGLLVVFTHSCPNNSIPVLHKSNSKWEGLFPRYV